MNYDSFLNSYLGKAIDWDGAYGAQCVDEIAQYCVDNNKPVAYANAKDWANNPALQGAFTWTANDPANYNQVPKRGDIIVWSGDLPGSGGYGHIAIFDMVVRAGVFQSLDQNWGGMYVHFVPNHTWDYILGWWTPKASAPANITQDELTQLYETLLGREPDSGGVLTYSVHTYDYVKADILQSAEYQQRQAQLAAQSNTTSQPPAPAPEPQPDPAPANPPVSDEQLTILKENNSLLKQILSIVTELLAKITSVFK